MPRKKSHQETKQQSKRYRLTKADQSKGGKRGGSKGGKKTAETYGPEYMKEIQSKGGKTNVERHGSEHMSAIGKKGAQTLHERYDADTKAAMVLDGKEKEATKRETIAQQFEKLEQMRTDEINYADEFLT